MRKNRPTLRDVHVPSAASAVAPVSKPWTVADPPRPATNWTRPEKERCVKAANRTLESSGDERQAIFACIRAAGKADKLLKCSDGAVRPLSVLEKQDGAMVALFLPERTAKKLTLPGGLPPEQLHVTLAYLGPGAELPDLGQVEAAVKEAAQKVGPLVGQVGGKIRFENPGQPEAAFCAVPDVPGLDRLRSGLIEALESQGIEVNEDHGFNPHVTLKYVGAKGRDPVSRVEPVPVTFDTVTLALGGVRREFPLGAVSKAKTFEPPESARNNAQKVLRWREEHPDEIKGMTSVGWRRARQLASGKPVSLDIVRRMAQFNRHRQNYEAARRKAEFRSEPWKSAAIVAINGWGGLTGIDWAKRISEANKVDKDTILKINGDPVTLGDLVGAWLSKQTKFTNAPWSDPQSDLSAEDYARVSLIDLNGSGEDKVKTKIKLPIRSRPGGPVNVNALRAVASALVGGRGGVKAPDEAKQKAARVVVPLLREAGVEVSSEALLRLAGLEKGDLDLDVEILKADNLKRVIYGVPLRPDDPDSQGDMVDTEEIEAAAWNFMIKSQRYDEQHQRLVPRKDVAVVENYLAPVDFKLGDREIKQGSWVLATKVFSDDLWAKIEKGEINAYSIKGKGNRRPVS